MGRSSMVPTVLGQPGLPLRRSRCWMLMSCWLRWRKRRLHSMSWAGSATDSWTSSRWSSVKWNASTHRSGWLWCISWMHGTWLLESTVMQVMACFSQAVCFWWFNNHLPEVLDWPCYNHKAMRTNPPQAKDAQSSVSSADLTAWVDPERFLNLAATVLQPGFSSKSRNLTDWSAAHAWTKAKLSLTEITTQQSQHSGLNVAAHHMIMW